MKSFSLLLKKTFASVVLMAGLLMPASAQAAVSIDGDLRPDYAPQGYSELFDPTSSAENKYGTTAINYVVADIAVVLLQVAGTLSIYFIVTSGFNYIKAFGREEELQGAKKGLTWAIVGLIVVILSYTIVQNIIRITLTVDQAPTAEASYTG